ncbi:MAG: hypothetical protein M1837_002255 [Sclerophora amabilis]|nr:MAG: hypothetical protein M1837_002255 [Sclerophora amabilis]
MNQPDGPPKPSIESLPVELKRAILSALPDVSTIKSAVLSSPSLYNAYIDAHHQILHEVLLKKLHPSLVSDALLTLRSSKLGAKAKDREMVQTFIQTWLRDRPPPLEPKWTLPDSIAVNELQSHVDFFSADFASSALSANPLDGSPDDSPSPPTEMESCRIQRAFYRFELHCHLFRHQHHQRLHHPHEDSCLFFASHSPWENEQLACIHDYLYKRLSIAFDDVAAHDVDWGEMSINYETDTDPPGNIWKQRMLSQGLSFLRRAVHAETYSERYQLLNPLVEDYNDYSLYDGLESTNRFEEPQSDLADWTSDEKALLINKPSVNDLDEGPRAAWWWTHEHNSRAMFVASVHHRVLRERGYVMWDRARLCRWGFFTGSWAPPPRRLGREAFERRDDEILESFRERSLIWRVGGKGWWSKDDYSHIKWPKGVDETHIRRHE